MNFFIQMINLQFTLFTLILIGVIFRKLQIISDEGQKTLSNLSVNIILPCNIVHSFMGGLDISGEFLKNCILAFLISLGIQVFTTLVGKYFFCRFSLKKRHIFTYGLIVSNSGFIGIPIIYALYGNIGVLYTSIFQIPARIAMWSSGLALFTDVNKKDAYRKLINHPCIIAVVIGIFFLFFPITLPTFVDNTISTISQCMLPVSMFAIGSMLSHAKFRQLLSPSILYYCLIRLLVYPIITLGILSLLNVDTLLTNVTVLLTAMPMANTTAILADKYDYDPTLASQTIFVSTLLSIITLPILSLLL